MRVLGWAPVPQPRAGSRTTSATPDGGGGASGSRSETRPARTGGRAAARAGETGTRDQPENGPPEGGLERLVCTLCQRRATRFVTLA